MRYTTLIPGNCHPLPSTCVATLTKTRAFIKILLQVRETFLQCKATSYNQLQSGATCNLCDKACNLCDKAAATSRQCGSNEYPQSMFWSKNKKNRYTTANPIFGV